MKLMAQRKSTFIKIGAHWMWWVKLFGPVTAAVVYIIYSLIFWKIEPTKFIRTYCGSRGSTGLDRIGQISFGSE